MKRSLSGLFVAGAFLVSIGCSPAYRSNLGVESWSGTTLAGEKVRFSDLKAKGVILNFYSPTCGPCIEELPAIEEYYEEAERRGIAMFVVVEADLEKNGLAGNPAQGGGKDGPSGSNVGKDGAGSTPGTTTAAADEATVRQLLGERMKADIAKYHMKVPVVIMDRPFTIRPDGLVTGTPETMLFYTAPFRLAYNFIGPLSTAPTRQDLRRSSRFSFAMMKLNEIVPAPAESGSAANVHP